VLFNSDGTESSTHPHPIVADARTTLNNAMLALASEQHTEHRRPMTPNPSPRSHVHDNAIDAAHRPFTPSRRGSKGGHSVCGRAALLPVGISFAHSAAMHAECRASSSTRHNEPSLHPSTARSADREPRAECGRSGPLPAHPQDRIEPTPARSSRAAPSQLWPTPAHGSGAAGPRPRRISSCRRRRLEPAHRSHGATARAVRWHLADPTLRGAPATSRASPRARVARGGGAYAGAVPDDAATVGCARGRLGSAASAADGGGGG
jgi:hypothetical protein